MVSRARLQAANIQAIIDISGSGCLVSRKATNRINYQDWRYILERDGPTMAARLSAYINSAAAPANVQQMVAKAKTYAPILASGRDTVQNPMAVAEADTAVRISFNSNSKSAYGRRYEGNAKWQEGTNHWNAYFNLDIGNRTFNTKCSIVSVTLHTKIHPDFRGKLGSFHIKQKTEANPNDYAFKRYGITKAGSKFSVSNVDAERRLDAEFLVFDVLVKQMLEDYFSNDCVIPVVPRAAPAPAPVPAPAPAPAKVVAAPAPAPAPPVKNSSVANVAPITKSSVLITNAPAKVVAAKPTAAIVNKAKKSAVIFTSSVMTNKEKEEQKEQAKKKNNTKKAKKSAAAAASWAALAGNNKNNKKKPKMPGTRKNRS